MSHLISVFVHLPRGHIRQTTLTMQLTVGAMSHIVPAQPPKGLETKVSHRDVNHVHVMEPQENL